MKQYFFKKFFFTLFTLFLNHCGGEVGLAPVFKSQVESQVSQIKTAPLVEPSAFSFPSITSKKEITIDINLEKIKEASSVIFSTHSSCLVGTIKDVNSQLTFTLPENAYNTTFSLYVRLLKGEEKSSCVELKKITHDDKAPTSLTLKINSGDPTTTSLSVSLSLEAVDASQMYVTNDETCSKNGEWETYKTSRDWTLAQLTQTNLTTVYVKFRDNAGNETSCIKASITELITEAPKNLSLTINNGSLLTSSTSVQLLLSATEADEVYVTNTVDCSGGGSWIPFSTPATMDWTLGQTNSVATVYAKFRSDVKLESVCISTSITHDGQTPSNSSLAINSNATYTTTTSVSLTLTATDATEVYVTNSSDCSTGGSWSSFSTPATKDWTLAQTNNTATVYAKFRDEAQNESSCISDSIIHDDIPPSITVSSTSGSTKTLSSDVTLSFTGSASQMYISNNAECSSGGSWENFSSSKAWTLSSNIIGSQPAVYTKFSDGAGNVSSCGTISFWILLKGTSDTDFDSDGRLSLVTETPKGFKVLSNGKSLIATTKDNDFAIRRYNANGSLDTTFGTAGLTTVDIDSSTDTLMDMTIQNDGKIVLAGTTGYDLAVVRLTSDGLLDNSFAGTGKAIIDVGSPVYGSTEFPNGRSILLNPSNGTINIIGDYGSGFSIVRLTSEGSLDTSFDSDGFAACLFDSMGYELVEGALLANNSIVLAGTMSVGSSGKLLLCKLTNNGSLDTSFGTSGEATFSNASSSDFNSWITRKLFVNNSGVITVLGNNGNFALARVNAGGTLDTSFDGNGTVSLDYGSIDTLQTGALLSNGKILVAGQGSASQCGLISRLNVDGSFDNTFGTSGTTYLPNCGSASNVLELSMDYANHIVVIGTKNPTTDPKSYVGVMSLDGVWDTNFGTSGMQELSASSNVVTSFMQFMDNFGMYLIDQAPALFLVK